MRHISLIRNVPILITPHFCRLNSVLQRETVVMIRNRSEHDPSIRNHVYRKKTMLRDRTYGHAVLERTRWRWNFVGKLEWEPPSVSSTFAWPETQYSRRLLRCRFGNVSTKILLRTFNQKFKNTPPNRWVTSSPELPPAWSNQHDHVVFAYQPSQAGSL